MNKNIVVALIIAAIVIVGGYLLYNAGPVVSAQGTSVMKVQPDEVSVYLTIETKNLSAVEAKNMNKEISDKVLTELVKLGLDRDEIKFVDYNEYQEYDGYYYDRQSKPKNWVVSQRVVVKLSDFDKVAEIIDVGTDAGALVSSIDFSLSQEKQNDYKAQALEAAGEDARTKAEATARGVGKSLGRLVSVQSDNFYYQPWNYYAKTMEAGVADIAAANVEAARAASSLAGLGPQDMEVRADISVVYKMSLF